MKPKWEPRTRKKTDLRFAQRICKIILSSLRLFNEEKRAGTSLHVTRKFDEERTVIMPQNTRETRSPRVSCVHDRNDEARGDHPKKPSRTRAPSSNRIAHTLQRRIYRLVKGLKGCRGGGRLKGRRVEGLQEGLEGLKCEA